MRDKRKWLWIPRIKPKVCGWQIDAPFVADLDHEKNLRVKLVRPKRDYVYSGDRGADDYCKTIGLTPGHLGGQSYSFVVIASHLALRCLTILILGLTSGALAFARPLVYPYRNEIGDGFSFNGIFRPPHHGGRNAKGVANCKAIAGRSK